jgi:hypothetical protein
LWKIHNCRVTVAAQYAAAAGFQSSYQTPQPQLPRISEVRALSATASALDGTRALTVADLASLMEMMADKTAAAIRQAGPAPQMATDANNMMILWKAMNDMQKEAREDTMRLVHSMQSRDPAEPAGEAEPSWIGSAMQALPQVIAMFAKPAPPPTLAGPPPAPAAPETAMINIPLTEVEAEPFRGPLALLRPFVPLILQSLDASPSVADVANNLVDWIPARLEDTLVQLDRFTSERGAGVLGLVSPLLANPRGVELIHHLATLLAGE